MKKEEHRPTFEPGAIFAIKLNPQEYGYFRVYRGSSRPIGVIPVISNGLVAKAKELKTCAPRWFFNFGVSPFNNTEIIKIGTIAFTDTDEGWPPPRFLPPSPFRMSFQIEERGVQRHATESETKGLQKLKIINPERLRRFFLSDCRVECHQQQGNQETEAEAFSPRRQSQGGRVFLEIVFQNKDFPFKGRDVVEDALAEALEVSGVGEVTGGGSGPKTANIDVEVSDVDSGLEIIRQTLRTIKAPASTEIHQNTPAHIVYYIQD